jgi:Tol biopolymer transport system component/DNA-binding winged helix-turn-helix (wHTH) protein
MNAQRLVFQFDDVQVDVENARVFKVGRRVSLEPKAFRVLVFLLEHPGRLIEKDQLLTAIWGDAFVTENTLTRAIALLRKALGDTKGEPKYIETVPTRGYRFIAAVTQEAAETVPTPAGKPGIALIETQKRRRVMWASVLIALCLTATVVSVRLLRPKSEPAAEYTPEQVTNSTVMDLYPSFSPDGNTLAYCSDENGSFEIFLKQLTPGGRTVQLTNDGGRNMQPAWSPDGTSIAYYSHAKGGLWLLPALGGVARQLTRFGSSPAWSPDGTQIVFESEGLRDSNATANVSYSGATLWIVNVKDGALRQLTLVDKPGGAHNAPIWSPDGKSIVFVGGQDLAQMLWSVSVDDGRVTKLGVAGHIYNPAFGRDPGHLYVSAEFGIWEIDLNGKQDEQGLERREIFNSLPEIPRHLTISSDGRKIAFSRMKTTSNIYSLPMSGDDPTGAPLPLTHDTRFRKTRPFVSPDGRRVLFSVESFDRNGGIWVIDADGKNSLPVLVPCGAPGWLPGSQDFLCSRYIEEGTPECKNEKCPRIEVLTVQLATGTYEPVVHIAKDADFGTYSRDGKQIAFMSATGGPPNVWVAPLNGGAPRQVTFDSESMGFPAWSPDGKALAVEQKHGDNAQIWIVEPGKPPVQLTRVPGQNWPSSFSTDGDKIAFAASRNGVWNLWWISRRDGSEKQLTSYTGFNHFVRYPDWAPDGKSMVYEYAETTGNIWMLEPK